MTSIASLKREWLANQRADILAGIVVALALIPEANGFSIIAGVDPRVGLYASYSIAVITALVGGRAGMIAAATDLDHFSNTPISDGRACVALRHEL